MRSFWSRIKSIGCHCHCYTCIENRHIQVRRLSVLVARIRCGRGLELFPSASRLALPYETPSIQQRRHFRLASAFQQANDYEKKQDSAEEGAFSREGSRDETGLYEQLTTARPANLLRVDQQRTREEDLKETAHEFQSLSIDHWSPHDVVRYEPTPGGTKPPEVPSTTTADPQFMMPQSPWASDDLKRQNYARIWTRKKIAKMETAIAQFTLRICQLLDLHTQPPSNLIVLPEAIRPFARLSVDDQEYLGLALKLHLQTLRNQQGYVPQHEPPNTPDELEDYVPEYLHFEDGSHHELLRDLNTSLVELFEGYQDQQLDFMALLVKICHNLLVSSAPPNVQTLNVLLMGFYSNETYMKVSNSQVRHLVLDWLIGICHIVRIRPNEVTCATTLASYRRRGKRHAFINYVRLMRAIDGDHALMYTRPLTLNSENAPRLTRTRTNPKIFMQAVYPSPMILGEVIKGITKFYTLEDAVAICKDFTAKQWGYDWKCLHYLLNACILERNWQTGLWVWDEIKAFGAAGHEEPVRILATMLALCVQCKQDQMFAEVLEYSTSRLKKISQAAFVEITTEILERAVDKIADDNLSALRHGLSSDDGDAGYETHGFERARKRRLDNDPAFKRIVFAWWPNIEELDKDSQYLDTGLQPDDDYTFKDYRMEKEAVEKEEEIENLHGPTQDNSPKYVRYDPQDLLRYAEGGADIEESVDSIHNAPSQVDDEEEQSAERSPTTDTTHGPQCQESKAES